MTIPIVATGVPTKSMTNASRYRLRSVAVSSTGGGSPGLDCGVGGFAFNSTLSLRLHNRPHCGHQNGSGVLGANSCPHFEHRDGVNSGASSCPGGSMSIRQVASMHVQSESTGAASEKAEHQRHRAKSQTDQHARHNPPFSHSCLPSRGPDGTPHRGQPGAGQRQQDWQSLQLRRGRAQSGRD